MCNTKFFLKLHLKSNFAMLGFYLNTLYAKIFIIHWTYFYYFIEFFLVYSTITLKRIIWEIGCLCTICMLELIPHMRSPLISHTIGPCFSFFDLTLFGGIRKIGHGTTSSDLRPSNENLYYLLLIDFLILEFINE